MRLALVAACTCFVAAASASPGVSQSDGERDCPPRSAGVQASSPSAVAYKRPRRSSLYACLRRDGRSYGLIERDWYPRPAVDVAGRVVAFADDDQEGAEDSFLNISVVQLRLGRRPRYRRLLYLSPAQVGSLRVKTNYSVAWISYETDAGRAHAQVLKRDSTTDTTTRAADTLAEGDDIDPRSLRLDGSDLSWVQAGERRHTTLR